MPNKILVIVLACFFLSLKIYSQTPPYYHYTSSDGLASSTVFDILQDKDGYLWFGTLNGLSRFDGKHFKNFSSADGLNSNVITSLLEENDGKIIIGNYENGINVLEKGSIKNFRSKINGSSFRTTYLTEFRGTVYAYTSYGVPIAIKDADSNNNSGIILPSPAPYNLFKLKEIGSDSLIALTSGGLFNFQQNQYHKMNIGGLPDSSFFCLTRRSDNTLFVGAIGCLYQMSGNKVTKKISLHFYKDKQFQFIYCDSKDNIWFSVYGKGFFCLQSGTDKVVDIGSKMGLQNTHINAFREDSEGNLWVATFGKGIYCLNNLYLRNYTENDGITNNNIICLEKFKDGQLLIGSIAGIDILTNGTINPLKDNSGRPVSGYVNNLTYDGDNVYISWVPQDKDIKSLSENGIQFNFIRGQSFCKTNDNIYVYGSVGNSIRITDQLKTNNTDYEIIPVFGDSIYQNRINAIASDINNNVWIGTSSGLCKIAGLTYPATRKNMRKTFFRDDPVLNSKINSIYCDSNNRVWFTGINGIAFYNLENDSVTHFTNLMNHKLSTPTSIAVENKNRIWIGTMKGLYLLDGNSIKYLNSQTGLPSDEILSLLFDPQSNVLFIGTSNGLLRLDIKAFDEYSHTPLSVKINSLQAGDSVFTNYDNLVFLPDQNNVYINFRVINYSSPASVTYKYILNGEYRETKNDFLDFSSLKKGDYKLQIYAGTQNTGWGKPFLISFKILPRFVETLWFDILIIFIILAAAAIIFRMRILAAKKKNKEQLELTERINELKHQALSALMNPHFIFNSLNSVQYLVNSNRLEEANDYIAMMAKLMRKNLDTAGSGFILLFEEISRLNLYLELEKLRFQERFSYEIITGDGIETVRLLIPNMIIQPFVENSLWHGILDSGINGKLVISFSFADVDDDSETARALIIKITDNGIGINKATKDKKEDHISKGIQIIEERLRLLSEKMEIPRPIMFEDLSGRGENSHGTEVIISLPPALYQCLHEEVSASISS